MEYVILALLLLNAVLLAVLLLQNNPSKRKQEQQAMQAQRAVTDMTNELLRKNADALKMGSIETAKEAERGVVDIETLKHTNEQLISTLDEVKRIQDEGREKRRAAEEELGRIEGQLKEKLLQVRGN